MFQFKPFRTILTNRTFRIRLSGRFRPGMILAVLIPAFPLPGWSQQRSTVYVDAQLETPSCTDYDVTGRTCGGGNAMAYRSLGAALPAAEAGTTVFLRSGSYADVLDPAHSGEDGRAVEFRTMPGESVFLTGAPAINLNAKDYIVIDGLNIEDTTWLEARDSHHNLIENCRFLNTPATGTTGNARFIRSNYNRIRNNRFENGNDNLLLIDANFNVVEGNTLLQGRHSVLGIRCGDNNIIRGNYLANSLQKIAEVYDCGQDTSAVPNSFDSTRRNVFENNVFADAVSYYSTSGGNGIQYAGQQGIIRRNVFYHCNVGLGMQVYADEALHNRDNHIYHNVFSDNLGPGIEIVSGTSGNTFKNNILSANKGVLPDCFNVSPGQLAYRRGLGTETLFERNDLFYQSKGQPVVEEDFNIGRTMGQAEALFGAELIETLEVDPLFVDPAGFDFHLSPDSPLRDAGAWLTTTTAAGSGTTLPVADASGFHDGFGIPGESGDLIQLKGQRQTVRVVHVDYASNTLSLDRELTWTEGQGISLPFEGSAPDLGAFETTATPVGIEAWRQLHFGDDAGNPHITGDLADPDKDGASNLMEYGLGGNPRVPDPDILPVFGNEGGRPTLVFRRDTSLTDIIFTVQESDALSDDAGWKDIAKSTAGAPMQILAAGWTVEETLAGSIKSVTVAEDPADAKGHKFMRLRISRIE